MSPTRCAPWTADACASRYAAVKSGEFTFSWEWAAWVMITGNLSVDAFPVLWIECPYCGGMLPGRDVIAAARFGSSSEGTA